MRFFALFTVFFAFLIFFLLPFFFARFDVGRVLCGRSPVQGRCGLEDEQTTQYSINWEAGAAGVDSAACKKAKKKLKGARKQAEAAGKEKLRMRPKRSDRRRRGCR